MGPRDLSASASPSIAGITREHHHTQTLTWMLGIELLLHAYKASSVLTGLSPPALVWFSLSIQGNFQTAVSL